MIDSIIDTLEREITLRQTALAALRELYQPRLPMKAQPKRINGGNGKMRRTPIASGSLADRIMSALKEAGEPTTLKVLLADSNALEADVRAALKELITDARVVQTGKSRGTRYQLP